MKKISLWLLLVLAAAMFVASCSKGGTFGGAEKGNFLDTLKMDDFRVDFKVIQQDTIAKSSILISKAAQGGTYIIVYCNATNAGSAPKRPISITVKLQDPNNAEYMWDLGATTSFTTTSDAITEKIISDINPGITVTTAYVFEVSKKLLTLKGWKLKFEMDKNNYLLDFAQKNVTPNKAAEMQLVPAEGKIDSFYVGKYEVTNAEYNSLIADDFYSVVNRNYKKADEKKPVASISWFDAVEFCNLKSTTEGLKPCYTINGEDVKCDFKANGYRLPTQMELAGALSIARDGLNESPLEGICWLKENSDGNTHDVGTTKITNKNGIHDLIGNVNEWLWDWEWPNSYSYRPELNIHGPQSGNERVYVGLSYMSSSIYLYTPISALPPNSKSNEVGFRLARSK